VEIRMELLLIRHGRPERIDHDPNGADPELTDLGHRQAKGMAEYLASEHIDAMYVSPQRRARQTAEPLMATLGLDAPVVDGIAEFDLGETFYIPGEELGPLSAEELDDLVAQMTEPSFMARVTTAIDDIIDRHPGERVAAVCHGGVISTVMNNVLGTDSSTYYDADYTSVTRIKASSKGRRSLMSFNECHWLRESK